MSVPNASGAGPDQHRAEDHHRVEGSDAELHVEYHQPDDGGAADGGTSRGETAADGGASRPVLLIHGFASSSKLNWHDAGWITALTGAGRRVVTVDLPGHGRSGSPDDLDAYAPSRMRADLLQILYDAHVHPLKDGDPATGVDIVGYSLGARLAWEFGATQPELVHRMVLGGPSNADPLADFDLSGAQQYLADGTPMSDETSYSLLKMAQMVPSNNIFALLSMIEAIKTEPFTPSEAVPHMPMLLVAGDKDELATSMNELADMSPAAQTLLLPGRSHTNAVTARAFKNAAIDFFAEQR